MTISERIAVAERCGLTVDELVDELMLSKSSSCVSAGHDTNGAAMDRAVQIHRVAVDFVQHCMASLGIDRSEPDHRPGQVAAREISGSYLDGVLPSNPPSPGPDGQSHIEETSQAVVDPSLHTADELFARELQLSIDLGGLGEDAYAMSTRRREMGETATLQTGEGESARSS